jgi:hypothetical protein
MPGKLALVDVLPKTKVPQLPAKLSFPFFWSHGI